MRHNSFFVFISISMAFFEDVSRVFASSDGLDVRSEISLLGRSCAVVSGHKGLCSISPAEVVVRLSKGQVRIAGSDLKVQKASSCEIFVSGDISSVSFPSAEGEARA